MTTRIRLFCILSLVTCHLSLISCSTSPTTSTAPAHRPGVAVLPGIYGNDSRQDGAPEGSIDVSLIPEPVPKVEPKARYGNIPYYKVLGKGYHTLASSSGYVERGIASWYGTKFHNHRTSSGEPYDIYAVTAAHKTLPLPTFVQVTNLGNGRRLIVRVNDRGPFHDNRVIDLSYAAAAKLGILPTGTGLVEVRAIDPRNHNSAPTLLAAASPQASAPIPAAFAPLPAVTPRRQVLAIPPRPPHPDQKLALVTPRALVRTAPPGNPTLYLQLGAFSLRANAEQLRTRLLGSSTAAIQIRPGLLNQATIYRVRLGPLSGVDEADRLSAGITRLGFGAPVVVID